MSEEENCSVHGMNLFGFYVPEDEGGVSTAAVIATTTASPQSAQVEEKRNYKTEKMANHACFNVVRSS